MAYHVDHRWGGSDEGFPLEQLGELYGELAEEDDEHPDVSLTHESGWCLGAYRSGLLVFEKLGDYGAPRHMKAVPREKVIDLWTRLAHGDLAALEKEPWLPGYF